MFAELLYPGFELPVPFIAVTVDVVFGFKIEFKLVVAVKCKAEHTHQVEIEFVQVFEVRVLVLLDLLSGFIHEPQRIVSQQIFHLNKIDEILQ